MSANDPAATYPVGQLMHAGDAGTGLYIPARHAAQDTPPTLVWYIPAAQLRHSARVLVS